MKRVLNDPDVFGLPFDKNLSINVPLLFPRENWKHLKATFEKKDKTNFQTPDGQTATKSRLRNILVRHIGEGDKLKWANRSRKHSN
jgi:hypothetical protein